MHLTETFCLSLLFIFPVFSNFIATDKPASITVLEGETATFHCHVSQQVRESYDVAWFSEKYNTFLSKNAILRHVVGLDADIRSRYSITRNFDHRFDLKIKNVKISDAGRFSCMFAYQDSPLQKAYYSNVGPEAELVVWSTPTAGSPTCRVNALENGRVEFVCASEGGNPKPLIQLYADDIRIQSKIEYTANDIYTKIVLTEDYRGVNLKCVLESKALQSPRICSLRPLPPVVRITPSIARVTEGDEVQFICNSRGLDSPTYEWLATPNLILMNRFFSNSDLATIRGTRIADNGSKILCTATGLNEDKVTSEEVILLVVERSEPVTQLVTSATTTIIAATELELLPGEPRARHTAVDFFQNNVIILAVCVAGIFILLLSMVAIVIFCKRKRESYNINNKIDDESMVHSTVFTKSYEHDDRITNGNVISEINKVEDKKELESTKENQLDSALTTPVSVDGGPIGLTSTSSKGSPKVCTTASQSSDNIPRVINDNNVTNHQAIPQYAKPVKQTSKFPPPAYATPIKREMHLSLEDVTGHLVHHFETVDSNSKRKNEYAELSKEPSPTNNKKNKYEVILPSPTMDPRRLNAEGLKYADLEISKNCSSEIRSDESMKTQYAELANP